MQLLKCKSAKDFRSRQVSHSAFHFALSFLVILILSPVAALAAVDRACSPPAQKQIPQSLYGSAPSKLGILKYELPHVRDSLLKANIDLAMHAGVNDLHSDAFSWRKTKSVPVLISVSKVAEKILQNSSARQVLTIAML